MPAAILHGVTEKSLLAAQFLFGQGGNVTPKFIVDDAEIIPQKFSPYVSIFQKRKFFNFAGNNQLEIISSADAQFLYFEGRITKFIALEPTNDDVENFFGKFTVAPNDLLVLTKS